MRLHRLGKGSPSRLLYPRRASGLWHREGRAAVLEGEMQGTKTFEASTNNRSTHRSQKGDEEAGGKVAMESKGRPKTADEKELEEE